MRAFDRAQPGGKQRDSAIALDASAGAVSRWRAAARRGGRAALRAHPAPGPVAKLTPEPPRLIPDCRGQGAESHGCRGDVWTCERVAGVRDAECGVSYGTSQGSRLRNRLGGTPRVPSTRAIERDEAALARWPTTSGPAPRAVARRARRDRVVVDESGFHLLPGLVQTAAPTGRTPVVDEWPTRDHRSIRGGVTGGSTVDSWARPQSLTGWHGIEFLVHLGRQVGDRPRVRGDGSPIPRRAAVQEFVAAGDGQIRLEPVPPYAPDRNPVPWRWRHRKEVERRKLTGLDLEQWHRELPLARGRVRQRLALVRSCFEGAGREL